MTEKTYSWKTKQKCNDCNEFLQTIHCNIKTIDFFYCKDSLKCPTCNKEKISITFTYDHIKEIDTALSQGLLSLTNQNHFKTSKPKCTKCKHPITILHNQYTCQNCGFFLKVESDYNHTPLEIKNALTTVNRILKVIRPLH